MVLCECTSIIERNVRECFGFLYVEGIFEVTGSIRVADLWGL